MMPKVPWLTVVTVVLSVAATHETARAVEPAEAVVAATEIAAAELGSPEAQAAMKLAEPVAEQARAFTHLARAARQMIDPVIFTGRTLLLVPQFARPARIPFTVMKTPFQLKRPAKAIDDLATIPGDLWAPFDAAGRILCDTPRLLGPLQAVGSIGEFASATANNARLFRSRSQ